MFKTSDIIEALGIHEDSAAIDVLEKIGTNSNDTKVREMTVKTLIRKNTHESLRVVLIHKGKGIHDYDATVATTAITSLLSLEDKTEAIKILDDTIYLHSDHEVKIKAQDVKDLIICLN